jgi:hypothetical protein
MRLTGLALVLSIGVVISGCSGGSSSPSSSNSTFTITPSSASIDTNGSVQFKAVLTGTSTPANVTWTVSGGDPVSSCNQTLAITSTGLFTPPDCMTQDVDKATVTATLVGSTLTTPTASVVITITPGFLQPLTPENATIPANGTMTFYTYTSEVGGSTGINYALSNTSTGSTGGVGTLSGSSCTRAGITSSNPQYTYCQVTYTAPSVISATTPTFLVATIGTTTSQTDAPILLNSAGISSSPLTNQNVQTGAIELGTSGGSNSDYDTATQNGYNYYIADCCGGTLGSLVTDGTYKYILSNNHVLARSDWGGTNSSSAIGSTIVQPGLIDDNCIPFGSTGSTLNSVASLTGYVPLNAPATNVDAAVAFINNGSVDPTGKILNLGTPSGGTLSPAAPAAGAGETATPNLTVAKSGRTTGLTCSSIAAVGVDDIPVEYFTDCAGTNPYITKYYNNQIAIVSNSFSDAGDSGSLIVDASNAEPVALLFAGGTDSNNQTETIAQPVGDVLSELGSTTIAPTSTAMEYITGKTFTFVGGTTHSVSCLNYDAGTFNPSSGKKLAALSAGETNRLNAALANAQSIVSSRGGILGVAAGKSYDHPGEAAVVVYTDKTLANVTVPATIGGVRTIAVPTTAAEIAAGTARTTPSTGITLSSAALSNAITIKNQLKHSLTSSQSYFGVGVSQSLDNPNEAALYIFVDKNHVPATLPATLSGLRTRYVIMNRLRITRSYRTAPHPSRCAVRNFAAQQPAWQPATERLNLR